MKEDKLLIALQKKYGNVIHYETFGAFGSNPNEHSFFDVEVFKGSMWLFHVLRYTVRFLNKISTKINDYIYSRVETLERLKIK